MEIIYLNYNAGIMKLKLENIAFILEHTAVEDNFCNVTFSGNCVTS